MKLITKIFYGLMCLSVLTFTSCGDDNNEPSEPEAQGSFSGDFTNNMNVQSEWSTNNVSAKHDTLMGAVQIKAINSDGDEINIFLTDTAVAYHSITTTENLSTYSSSSLSTTATTASNDTIQSMGYIQITSSGMADNMIEGMGSVKWVELDPDTIDPFFGVMQNISFSIPITRGVITEGGGPGGTGSSAVSADLNGNPFTAINSTSTSQSGNIIVIGIGSSASITVNIPAGATVGDHELTMSSDYSVTYMPTGSTDIYVSSEGTMNISAVDGGAGTVTGTFSCTVTNISGGGDSIEMTNGSFSVE